MRPVASRAGRSAPSSPHGRLSMGGVRSISQKAFETAALALAWSPANVAAWPAPEPAKASTKRPFMNS